MHPSPVAHPPSLDKKEDPRQGARLCSCSPVPSRSQGTSMSRMPPPPLRQGRGNGPSTPRWVAAGAAAAMRQWLIWLDCGAMRCCWLLEREALGRKRPHSLPRTCGFRSRRPASSLPLFTHRPWSPILALVAWQGQGSGHGVLAACSPTLPLGAWDFPSRSHRPLGI
jgi:hypothetical protein